MPVERIRAWLLDTPGSAMTRSLPFVRPTVISRLSKVLIRGG